MKEIITNANTIFLPGNLNLAKPYPTNAQEITCKIVGTPE